jgi:hypothetical protein
MKARKFKISNCCSSPDGGTDSNGPSWSDLGMCPECHEYCEFIDSFDDPDLIKIEPQPKLPIRHDNKMLAEALAIVSGKSRMLAHREHLNAAMEFYHDLYRFLKSKDLKHKTNLSILNLIFEKMGEVIEPDDKEIEP